MSKRLAVILAAGKGTRMKSDLYKVLHPVNGLAMIEHVVDAVQAAKVDQIVTVVGFGAQAVKELLGEKSQYALQEEQLGTGHAVQQAKSILAGEDGATLVICGDTPLISAQTINQLFDFHEQSGAKGTVLTAQFDNPFGYGRIIRQTDGTVSHIVEEKDANDVERLVTEINTGTYVFDNQLLFEMLDLVTNDNAQGEYYLPDVIGLLQERGHLIAAHVMTDADEALGVNDRLALAEAGRLMSRRINRKHMLNGVTLINPATTYIEAQVQIGPDTVIEGGVSLKGQTRIGSHAYIGAHSEICDSQIGDQVQISQSVIEKSTVERAATIGPFAHLRPNSHLMDEVHIGNFVEVKNSTIGKGTKSGHLTYIGDADLGKDINIGCGTIFVNYDGKYKHRSTVGDQAFIGCDTKIMSPVEIGPRTVTAAGSVITDDIPEDAMGIARSRQTNIPNYYPKFINK